MHPFLLQLEDPPLVLRSLTVMYVLAVLACWLVVPRWAERREGLDRRAVLRALMVLGIAAFVGGRIQFLSYAWPFVLHRARYGVYDTLLYAGFHAGGAIVGIFLAAPLVLRWYRLPAARFGDAVAPGIGIGIALARLGCFLEGCCWGTPCPYSWCLSFPEPSNAWDLHRHYRLISLDAHASAPVHPLQLYFVAAALAIVAVGWWLQRRKSYDGQVMLVLLVLFSATSWLFEPLRANFAMRAYWGRLPLLEVVAGGMTIASCVALAAAEIAHRRRTAMVTA